MTLYFHNAHAQAYIFLKMLSWTLKALSFLLFSASRSSPGSGHRCYHWGRGRKHVLLAPIQAGFCVGVECFGVGFSSVLFCSVLFCWVGGFLQWVMFSVLFQKQSKVHVSHTQRDLQLYPSSLQQRKGNSITNEKMAFWGFFISTWVLWVCLNQTLGIGVFHNQYQNSFSISHLDVALYSSFVSCGVFLGNINWTDFVIFPWLLSLQDVPCARWLTWMNSLYIVKNHFLLLFMTRFFHLSCFSVFSLLHRWVVMPDWDEAVTSSYFRKPCWDKKACQEDRGHFLRFQLC